MAFEAGVALVPVLPQATGFSAALTKQVTPAITKMETGLKGTVQRLSSSVTGLGTSIGTTLGLGLAVAGVAAGRMALDFENAFTKIAALSNSSADDIARWKGEVLDLAGTTARAPQELADALFFLSSAGLESGQVMEALNVSAKAAAVGLGTTVDVANIVASSLNAYADSGLRAADVTDTLVAAVRAGRAEPEAFANSLGKLLPIAVQAGVSFQDLTASLASLSNVGLDVDEAATAMRGALQAIAAPGSAAADAMDQLGLSAQDLLDAISQRGLFGAFQLLDQAARDNTSSQAEYIGVLRKVIPNVRALTGILGLTGQEAAKVDAVFHQTANSTGDLNTAFQKWVQGPGASFAKLMNEMKVAAIKFGEAILPIARTLANVLTPVLKLAADHAELLLTAFLGYKALTFLPELLLGIAVNLERIGATGLAGLALKAATAGEALTGTTAATVALAYAIGTIPTKPIEDASTKVQEYLEILQRGGSANEQLVETNTKVAVSLGANETAFRNAIASGRSYSFELGNLEGAAAGAAPKMDGLGNAIGKLTEEHQKAAQAARDQLSAELALAGNLTGILGDLQSAADASDSLAGARRKLDRLTEAGKQGTAAYRQAVDDVAAAQLAALDAQLNLASAVESYASAVHSGGLEQKDAIDQLKTFGTEAGLTKGEIADMIETLRTAIHDYDDLASSPNINKKVTLTADTSQARSQITQFLNELQAAGLQVSAGALQLAAHESALGFHGDVSRPTLFLTGEAGPERVDITPKGEKPPTQIVQGAGSGRISGQLSIIDWRRGVAVLDAEITNMDRVSGR